VKSNYGETVLTDELHDLRELKRALTEAFPQIEALYLFGRKPPHHRCSKRAQSLAGAAKLPSNIEILKSGKPSLAVNPCEACPRIAGLSNELAA
jgi:hypothetical protein